MTTRIHHRRVAPGAGRAMQVLETYVNESELEPNLLDLVRLRASQINGCAYCVDMHSLDLHAAGETEQRVNTLAVWEDTPFFSERERAALLWTEKLTLISLDHVPDAVYERVRPHFSDQELADLTLAIARINAWHRFGISFRDEPGHYTAKERPAKA